jgi:predicted anti-sigma-YlaC factor YlaD
MKCKQVESYFSAYCEGELDEATQTGMAQHLTQCTACRQALEAFEQMLNDLQTATPTPAPSDLPKTVQARLKGTPPSGRLRSPKFNWFKMPLPLVTATALGVLIFAIVYLPEQQEHAVRKPSKAPVIEEAQDSGTARLERKKSVIYQQKAAKPASPATTKPTVSLTLHWTAARPDQDTATALGSGGQDEVATASHYTDRGRQMAPSLETAARSAPRPAPAAPRPMAADQVEAEWAKETTPGETPALGEPTLDERPAGSAAEGVVQQVAESVGGRIVTSHQSDDSPALHVWTIALPAPNYPELLIGLRQWGRLEAPSQITAKQGEIFVQLNIKAPF